LIYPYEAIIVNLLLMNVFVNFVVCCLLIIGSICDGLGCEHFCTISATCGCHRGYQLDGTTHCIGQHARFTVCILPILFTFWSKTCNYLLLTFMQYIDGKLLVEWIS